MRSLAPPLSVSSPTLSPTLPATLPAFSRRRLLQAAGVGLGLAGTRRASAAWEPSPRYPDPAIKILDPSFAKYRIANAGVERLATGMRWCEGPVWLGDQRALLWSDIPNDRIMRYDEVSGAVSEFRRPANHANGNTRDRQGRLITCEHLGRRVTRTEYDGSISVLASSFEGKPLNSPNDVVVKSDGSIWFTDPPFGILHHYEGSAAKPELPTNVYRIDPQSGKVGKLAVVLGDLNRPNGLCFSPDESKLYIGENGVNPRLIHVYDVGAGGKLSNKKLFLDCGQGTVDGFRCDVDGNLWCGWGMGSDELDGVMVFNPAGKPIGRIQLPERCANLCFGGLARNRLFMAASHSVYALYVGTQGVAGR
jgi:gluconolactonase